MHRPTTTDDREPDVAQCKTSRISATWPNEKPLISHCLNEQEHCRYGMSFAYGCLCKHPHHLDFASEEEQPGA